MYVFSIPLNSGGMRCVTRLNEFNLSVENDYSTYNPVKEVVANSELRSSLPPGSQQLEFRPNNVRRYQKIANAAVSATYQ